MCVPPSVGEGLVDLLVRGLWVLVNRFSISFTAEAISPENRAS